MKNKYQQHFGFLFWAGLLLTVFICVGCSGRVKLKGKVVYSDDGTPVNAGRVMFVQGNDASRGTINKDGTFELSTLKSGDGIPQGEYQVYITGALKPGPQPMQTIPLIDQKYTKPETSGLTINVNKSTKVYEIKVDRYKP